MKHPMEMEVRQRAVLNRVRVNAPATMLRDGLLDLFLKLRIRPEVGLDFKALDDLPRSDLASMADRLKRAGLRPSAHGPFWDLSPGAMDPKIRQISRDRYAMALEAAARFEAEHIVFHPDFEWWRHEVNRSDWLDIGFETWRPLAKRASTLGVRLVLENVFERTPVDLALLLAGLSGEGVGFCLDVGHANAFGRVPLDGWLDAFGPILAALHLHDNRGGSDEHLPVGAGGVDFICLMGRLGRMFPEPPALTLEPHKEGDLWPGLDYLAGIWPWAIEP